MILIMLFFTFAKIIFQPNDHLETGGPATHKSNFVSLQNNSNYSFVENAQKKQMVTGVRKPVHEWTGSELVLNNVR